MGLSNSIVFLNLVSNLSKIFLLEIDMQKFIFSVVFVVCDNK